jgi:hypothetical protein
MTRAQPAFRNSWQISVTVLLFAPQRRARKRRESETRGPKGHQRATRTCLQGRLPPTTRPRRGDSGGASGVRRSPLPAIPAGRARLGRPAANDSSCPLVPPRRRQLRARAEPPQETLSVCRGKHRRRGGVRQGPVQLRRRRAPARRRRGTHWMSMPRSEITNGFGSQRPMAEERPYRAICAGGHSSATCAESALACDRQWRSLPLRAAVPTQRPETVRGLVRHGCGRCLHIRSYGGTVAGFERHGDTQYHHGRAKSVRDHRAARVRWNTGFSG